MNPPINSKMYYRYYVKLYHVIMKERNNKVKKDNSKRVYLPAFFCIEVMINCLRPGDSGSA